MKKITLASKKCKKKFVEKSEKKMTNDKKKEKKKNKNRKNGSGQPVRAIMQLINF